MSQPLLIASGMNGQLEVHPTKIKICRKGLLAFAAHGFKGDKDVLLSAITSIQLKNANLITNGYIQFGFSGSLESKDGLTDAVSDENTIMFTRGQQAAFMAAKTQIENLIHTSKQPAQSQTTTSSQTDELIKLAKLREQGVLSDDEFQQMKQKILTA
jgi:hypothetical protein